MSNDNGGVPSGVDLSWEEHSQVVRLVTGLASSSECSGRVRAVAVALTVVLHPEVHVAEDGTLARSIRDTVIRILGCSPVQARNVANDLRSLGLTTSTTRGRAAKSRVVWPANLRLLLLQARAALTRRRLLEAGGQSTDDRLIEMVLLLARLLSGDDPALLARMADAIRQVALEAGAS